MGRTRERRVGVPRQRAPTFSILQPPRSPRSPIFKFVKPKGNTTASGIYLSPYVTCKECNAINFVNALRVGLGFDMVAKGKHALPSLQTDEVREKLHMLEAEVLPVCIGCGRTINLVVGATDFTPSLAEEATAFQEAASRRNTSVVHIQRVGRGMLGRKEATRRRMAKAARDKLERWASTTIQRLMRGVISRQTTRIKSGIRIIEWTYPLIKKKLLNDKDESKKALFWFEGEDLGLVVADYRLFVDRAGPLMSLRRFEANVVLFVHRINKEEHRMAMRIQARWRGMQARRALLEVRRAIAWIGELRFHAAILVQRTVRRYAGGKRTRRHSFQRQLEKSRRRAQTDAAKMKRARGLQRDVDRADTMYKSYRRKTDKLADWVIPRNIPRTSADFHVELDVLTAFAKNYGSSMSPEMQKHSTEHAEARRQIHRFLTKRSSDETKQATQRSVGRD
ncbi:Aste57867_13617 [Aphanomyces stellatus]|uniref:Aste57867_13617 protein n=1 Tax=Aphanomyces stellatus TaxID=120398 RepID=A0A485KZ44_9STRA|nr:hypothetical protein As57867_013567 [Aphanomyces stellatus]VFT90454.1 Aste57867_13617 [Aphanomyces stellatus]